MNAVVRQLEGDDITGGYAEALPYRQGQGELPLRGNLCLTPCVQYASVRTRACLNTPARSAPLGENDTVPIVFIEEVEAVNDPRVEAAADMLCNFLDNVTPVLEPLQFRTSRHRKDGLFAFFAVIPELHRESIPGRWQKASARANACASRSSRARSI
jgi:hypothetical protein